MVKAKLYVHAAKSLFNFKKYDAVVYKSGMLVKMRCDNKEKEDELIEELRKNNFIVEHDAIPSNGSFTLWYNVERQDEL